MDFFHTYKAKKKKNYEEEDEGRIEIRENSSHPSVNGSSIKDPGD